MTRAARMAQFVTMLVIGLASSLAFSASAAKFNKVLDIGKPAPAWSDLLGVDGKRRGLRI